MLRETLQNSKSTRTSSSSRNENSIIEIQIRDEEKFSKVGNFDFITFKKLRNYRSCLDRNCNFQQLNC